MARTWNALCSDCCALLHDEELKSVGLIGQRECAGCGAWEPWPPGRVGSNYTAASDAQVEKVVALRKASTCDCRRIASDPHAEFCGIAAGLRALHRTGAP